MMEDAALKIPPKTTKRKLAATPKLLLLCALLAIAAGSAQAQLPPSKNAPKVGEKAPDFTLPDSTGKPERLYELLSSEPVVNGATAENSGGWVLLIFYRGYW